MLTAARNPLQFVHVPKCGGNTIRRILQREYGADRVYRLGPGATDRLAALAPEIRHSYSAFTGHIAYGLDAIIGPVDVFSMLRHPVDRIVSSYQFALTRPGHPMREHMLEGVSDLDGYVTRSPVAPLVNNGMARFLGGDATVGWPPATEQHFDAAAARIRDGQIFVGLFERFIESVALFQRAYGWRTPIVEHANQTPERADTATLEPGTVALIEAHNEYDLALYDLGRTTFAAAMDAAGGLHAEVRAMRRRTQRARWEQAPRRALRSVKRRLR